MESILSLGPKRKLWSSNKISLQTQSLHTIIHMSHALHHQPVPTIF